MGPTYSRKWSRMILALIVVAAGILVLFGPEEKTLGSGIKVVYIHVASIWAGMIGLFLAGVLGIGVLIFPNRNLQAWTHTVAGVALASFAVGVGLSIVAAKINWGAAFWNEPRMVASLRFLAVALLVQILNSWLPWYRLRGFLSVSLGTFLMWSILGPPLVLHPKSPIRESSSLAIQLTFLGMFILCCLVVAWFVWYVRRKSQ
ncbi:MAG: hypothetical protein ACE5NG_19115 [bacterium]